MRIVRAFPIVMLGIASAAQAANWVQVDPYLWVDVQSISRSGNLATYSYASSQEAASNGHVFHGGYDCVTRRVYVEDENGRLSPSVPDETDTAPYTEETNPVFRLVCRR